MAAAALMIQGTGSDVGKSLLVAGLCRAALRRGISVLPFKPQNMSNNAAVTTEGGEIGRAQALQARACGVDPSVDMNPILLKPESERGAQLVVRGKARESLPARAYQARKAELLGVVLESFEALAARADLVLVEGAGSPAEINLRANDIANMGFALAAGVPVILAGDIDRGGVIAALVGTHAVLADADRAQVKGFLINKFRGDPSLFDQGLVEIVRRTGWPSLGVVPHLPSAWRLPPEDAVALDRPRASQGGAIRIAVPHLPRIANFEDLDPLRLEPGVTVAMLEPGRALPADTDLVILPGSKSTIADLAFLRDQGWDIDILAHARRGGRVIGLCAGYQMLGRSIADPDGVEGPVQTVPGLGLLPVDTVLTGDKRLVETRATALRQGVPVSGYEIHVGRTTGEGQPMLRLADGRMDGREEGRVAGCYLHGLFAGSAYRAALLAELGGTSDPALDYGLAIESALDELAESIERHLDVGRMLEIAATARTPARRAAG